uniref:Uncharacterized protein n=1 Tax=Glossina brevipalpis TaxID=37001 RepID=A0A1A9WZP7_9MUSC
MMLRQFGFALIYNHAYELKTAKNFHFFKIYSVICSRIRLVNFASLQSEKICFDVLKESSQTIFFMTRIVGHDFYVFRNNECVEYTGGNCINAVLLLFDEASCVSLNLQMFVQDFRFITEESIVTGDIYGSIWQILILFLIVATVRDEIRDNDERTEP